jgi:diguanylate cyclase (GGDEF)-like protein/PAS domain S-box-containing protein
MQSNLKSTLLDALLEASLDGIVILEPELADDGALVDLVFTVVNDRAQEVLDRRGQRDLVGQWALRDFFDGDEAAFSRYRGVWETGEAARFEVDRPASDLATVFRVSAVKADDMVIVTFADVTELIEASEALEQQRVELLYQYEVLDAQATDLARIAEDTDAARTEARNAERFVADLLEAIPIPVFFRSRENGRYQMVNQRYAELHGCSRDDVVGRAPDEFLPPAILASIESWDQALCAGEEPRQAYEDDMSFSGVGDRRMILHKAKMWDASNRLIGVTGVMVDVTESHRLRQELERLATTDPLTGLSNRRAFLMRARQEIERAVRNGRPMSVVMIDVDHFKAVNDRYGHDIGDLVLQSVAATVEGGLRNSADVAARFGGEEFVLLLPETTVSGAQQLAERIRVAFERAVVETEQGAVRFTASFGVEAFRSDVDVAIDTVLKRADDALYRAKASGRNRVHLAA